MVRRLVLLYTGLLLWGPAAALLIRTRLGLDPWNVLHIGIADRMPISVGTVIIVLSGIVLLLWIPLRQRPGLGTISNALLVGMSLDFSLPLVPEIEGSLARVTAFLVGILLIGLSTGMYIGAGFGPGPRDGLMTGIAARAGWSLRKVRTGIELSVLAGGWLLGGQVGIGTVAFALLIGPIIQMALPMVQKLVEGFSLPHPAAAGPKTQPARSA